MVWEDRALGTVLADRAYKPAHKAGTALDKAAGTALAGKALDTQASDTEQGMAQAAGTALADKVLGTRASDTAQDTVQDRAAPLERTADKERAQAADRAPGNRLRENSSLPHLPQLQQKPIDSAQELTKAFGTYSTPLFLSS